MLTNKTSKQKRRYRERKFIGIEEIFQQEEEEHSNPDFKNPRMKQEVQVADHCREETLVEEGLYPEVEAEEEIFGALHVVNGDMGHGTVVIVSQEPREM